MTTTTFDFENVSGPTPDRRRFGSAHFALDTAVGRARCTQIVLSNPKAGKKDIVLDPGMPKFDEVLTVLLTERREDIDLCLEAARDVGHALAFRGELLPSPAYRGATKPLSFTASAW